MPALVALALVAGGPAAAQNSPPQGVLRAPSHASKPARRQPPPPPPRAAPITGVQRVAPFSSPVLHPAPRAGSVLGHTAPGKAVMGKAGTGKAGTGKAVTRHTPPRHAARRAPPRRVPVVRAPRHDRTRKAPARKNEPRAAISAKPAVVAASAAALVVAAATQPAAAPPPAATPTERPKIDQTKGTATGLPLPRWVALRSADVNMRAGPGMRYPVEWQYHRRSLPVKLEREFQVWRLVEDPDGVKGWVHQANLTSRRGFVLKGPEQTLRAGPSDTAAAVALIKPDVVGRILSCKAGAAWCRVSAGGYGGWLKRSTLWGIFADETIGN